MKDKTQNIHEKANKVIVQYAIFRWENAVLLAGAILLTVFYPKPFIWWPSWGWLFSGLIGMGLIFYSSLTNTELNSRLLLQSFQEKYSPKQIEIPELKAAVEEALNYQMRIEKYLWQQDNSILWDRAQDTASQIRDWIANVYYLAGRLDAYWRDGLFKQEINELPKEIETLTKQKGKETNTVLLLEFQQLIESKQNHLKTLQTLDSKMKQADLQLKHSLSALATIDSQIRLIAAQDVDRGRSDRLKEDIQEQINRLSDLLNSINEVYKVSGEL